MEHNKDLSSEEPLPGLSQLIQEARNKFFKKLKYFIASNSERQPPVTKYVNKGSGFLLFSHKEQPNLLSSLIEDVFSCSYQEFVRQANRFGFSVKSKQRPSQQVIFFSSHEKIEENNQNSLSESFQSSEEEDEFPKEEEMEAVIREREDKAKSAFVKPSIILNRVLSEGMMGHSNVKKQEDASIEVKLKQAQFSTPLAKIQDNSIFKLQEGNATLSLADRILLQRQNYEKCSKLIDNTIIELLQAHRGKKVEQCKQNLIEKVVQIYDLLSNSIENTSRIVPVVVEAEVKNQQKNDQ